MLTGSKALISAAIYGSLATAGGIVGNFFVGPALGYGHRGTFSEVFTLVIWVFPIAFAFFWLVFAFAARLERRDVND